MQKHYLLMFSGLLMSALAFGQGTIKAGQAKNIQPAGGHKAIAAAPKLVSGLETNVPFSQSTSQTVNSIATSRGSDEEMGETFYDLQTNSAIMRRVASRPNGDVSAAWTMSQLATGWGDRGSGYNVRRGGTWNPAPTTRIETVRTGFTNLCRQGGRDMLVAHGTVAPNTTLGPVVTFVTDAGVATTVGLNTVAAGALWFRSAVDGNNIHIIGITNPPTIHLGTPGHLLYWRSKDGGATWDKQATVIKGIDSTTYKIGLTADSYSISARAGRVAIGLFNTWNDSDVWVSENNGDAFTKAVTLYDFPLDNYVANSGYDPLLLPPGSGDINDTTTIYDIRTTDNAGNVIIDNNGLIHAVFSTTNVNDQDTTDAGWTYYPASSGIFYWNEGRGDTVSSLIPNLIDWDGNGIFENPTSASAGFATYSAAASTDPQLSVHSDGTMYLVFRSAYELSLFTADDEFLNHSFVLSTKDGITWDGPIDLFYPGFYGGDDTNQALAEGVYASMEEVVTGNRFRVAYQRDFEPEVLVQATTAAPHNSDFKSKYILFDLSKAEIDQYLITGTKVLPASAVKMQLNPNPATDVTRVNFALEQSARVQVQVVNMMGQTVRSTATEQFGAGVSAINVNTSDLATGIYLVRLNAGGIVATSKLVVAER
jgi:Secretion system C-terminal sorting domain